MREHITKILNSAVTAPSGDNSQPWHFVVSESSLLVYKKPELDNPVYNFRERGTLIAHGALAENIAIASRELGREAVFSLFPKEEEPHLVSSVTFIASDDTKDDLYEFIKKRETNRKKYRSQPLSAEQKRSLSESIGKYFGLELTWFESEADRKKIAKAVSKNEIVMLSNKLLHSTFFSDIRWTEAEELEKKRGLYLKTLELKPPQEAVFKLFRNWTAARMLNALRFPKIVAKENAEIYSSGSAIGFITLDNADRETVIKAGRGLQRLWLTATAMGMSFQPITAILYLIKQLNDGNDIFSDKQIKLIKTAERELREVHDWGSRIPIMLFRVGFGDKASANSSRREPEIKFN